MKIEFSDDWSTEEPTLKEGRFSPELPASEPSNYLGYELTEILAEIDQFQVTQVVPAETVAQLRGAA